MSIEKTVQSGIVIGSRVPSKAFQIQFREKEVEEIITFNTESAELLNTTRSGDPLVLLDTSKEHGVEDPEKVFQEIRRMNPRATVLKFAGWSGFAALTPAIMTHHELHRQP